MHDYTSDDFAAFLVFAGPLDRGSLQSRLDYVGKCDEFCQEYFHGKKPTYTTKLHVGEEWVEFYTAFTKWFAIRHEMSQAADSDLDTMAYQVMREGNDMTSVTDWWHRAENLARDRARAKK